MRKYFRVIDGQKPIKQNYFSLVFFRDDRVRGKVSRLRWMWLCLIELLFGEEILESLVTTASVSGCPEDKDPERKYGKPQQLNLHIPSGIFTNLLRKEIIQVLYYKYYLQYLFIRPIAEPYENKNTYVIDVTCDRFRLDKGLLYLVIAFRRVYIFSALLFNIVVDLVVYLISSSLEAAIVAAVLTESIRRIFKI
jgi:hypothetical protein